VNTGRKHAVVKFQQPPSAVSATSSKAFSVYSLASACHINLCRQ